MYYRAGLLLFSLVSWVVCISYPGPTAYFWVSFFFAAILSHCGVHLVLHGSRAALKFRVMLFAFLCNGAFLASRDFGNPIMTWCRDTMSIDGHLYDHMIIFLINVSATCLMASLVDVVYCFWPAQECGEVPEMAGYRLGIRDSLLIAVGSTIPILAMTNPGGFFDTVVHLFITYGIGVTLLVGGAVSHHNNWSRFMIGLAVSALVHRCVSFYEMPNEYHALFGRLFEGSAVNPSFGRVVKECLAIETGILTSIVLSWSPSRR